MAKPLEAFAEENGSIEFDNWQPIETAPKDGTKILVYTVHGDIEISDWSLPSTQLAAIHGVTDSHIRALKRGRVFPRTTGGRLMVEGIGGKYADFAGTHIEFYHHCHSPSGKTSIWKVTAKDGSVIGCVAWFSRWRRYSFFPQSECVFEQVCLREIATFIEDRTSEHRKAG